MPDRFGLLVLAAKHAPNQSELPPIRAPQCPPTLAGPCQTALACQ